MTQPVLTYSTWLEPSTFVTHAALLGTIASTLCELPVTALVPEQGGTSWKGDGPPSGLCEVCFSRLV